MTQKELAEKAKVSLRTVSGLEQGLHDGTFPTVLALAAALGVDCTAFTEAPEDREPSGPGRPRKAEEKPKGKPRKKGGGK